MLTLYFLLEADSDILSGNFSRFLSCICVFLWLNGVQLVNYTLKRDVILFL